MYLGDVSRLGEDHIIYFYEWKVKTTGKFLRPKDSNKLIFYRFYIKFLIEHRITYLIFKILIEMSDENEMLRENLEAQLERLVQQLSDLEECR